MLIAFPYARTVFFEKIMLEQLRCNMYGKEIYGALFWTCTKALFSLQIFW